MVSKHTFSSFLALSLLLLAGCGNQQQIPTNPLTKEKNQNRTVLEKIQNRYGEGGATLFVTNDKKDFIFYLFAYGDIKTHKQLYLDLDKSGKSGYTPYEKEGIGAEYLIEDNKLFRFTGKNNIDWSWEYIDSFQQPSKSAPFLKVPLTYFENLESFNVQAIVYDSQWKERFPSEVERATKVLDPFKEIQNVQEGQSFTISQDSLNYYFIWLETQNNYEIYHRQFFIDSDQNPQTGYDDGADYLIEDKHLFKYNGKGGRDWNWIEIDRVSFIQNFPHTPFFDKKPDHNLPYHILPKNLVQEWNETIFIKAVAIDQNWENHYTTSYYPYHIKKEQK